MLIDSIGHQMLLMVAIGTFIILTYIGSVPKIKNHFKLAKMTKTKTMSNKICIPAQLQEIQTTFQ